MQKSLPRAEEKAHIEFLNGQLVCSGFWNIYGINRFGTSPLSQLRVNTIQKTLPINGSKIKSLDTAGSLIIRQIIEELAHQGFEPQLVNFSTTHQALLHHIAHEMHEEEQFIPPTPMPYSWVTQLGMLSVFYYFLFLKWLRFIGEVTVELARLLRFSAELKWKYFLNIVETAGLRALPIVGFLALLIGIVLAYEIGIQLRNYGANVYIVNILGMTVLREFSPLITAIILAGRTGAAFTAQIGMMKVDEEIDALRTMGSSPINLLVLPRVVALLLVMPFLILWADIFGIIGGMLMAKAVLGITYYNFLHRFEESVTLTSFLCGLGKAPTFALIIALVGSFQGLQATTSAGSVGWQTTKSVVLAIFFLIFTDAIYSVIYSWWSL